jgi:cytochrome b561
LLLSAVLVIAIHIAAAMVHALVWHDRTLARMWHHAPYIMRLAAF